MPKSMTGFGRGEAAENHRKFLVEIRAVNGRHLDIAFKMPRFLFPFEDLMRKRIAAGVFRGKLEVWVSFESSAPQDFTVGINEPYVDALAQAINRLSEKFGIPAGEGLVSIDTLLKLPDVLVSGKIDMGLGGEDLEHELWGLLEGALDAALLDFNKMRQREGAALALELAGFKNDAAFILEMVRSKIAQYQEANVERLKQRITELVGKLGTNLDSERLHTEVAYLADKSDISEELARLASHFGQFAALLEDGGALGRKIDFIVQEMNREANTIGSKSQSAELTNYVVELKSIIEKIREQAQNIE